MTAENEDREISVKEMCGVGLQVTGLQDGNQSRDPFTIGKKYVK